MPERRLRFVRDAGWRAASALHSARACSRVAT
jgi:hypothetical protein